MIHYFAAQANYSYMRCCSENGLVADCPGKLVHYLALFAHRTSEAEELVRCAGEGLSNREQG